MIGITTRETACGPIHNVSESTQELIHGLIWFTDDRKLIKDIIRDERSHLVPLALFRQSIEFGLEFAKALYTEHRRVGRRGSIKSDLLTYCLFCLVELRLVRTTHNKTRVNHLKVIP